MGQALSDEERVLKLIERARLLIAIDDEIPTKTKLNTQPMLKMLEGMITSGTDAADQQRASSYYGALYAALQPYPDVEALLTAMRVFLPYL